MVGNAVMGVISSVFLHETLKSAATDDDLMLMQWKRSEKKHVKKMQRFYETQTQPVMEVQAGKTSSMYWSLRMLGHSLRLKKLMDTSDETLTGDELVLGV